MSSLPPPPPPPPPSDGPGQPGQPGQPGYPGQPGPLGPRPTQPPMGAGQPGPHPEILDPRAGTALGAAGGGGRRGSGLKKGLLIGGGVVGLAVVGGAAWAATSFFSTGAQPAEALPNNTLGYVSVDLDPSGGQKIEAVQTINKFPKFKDIAGVDAGDDLRKSIFDAIQGEAQCEGLDFEDDIDPWLGNRAALAAVEDADGAVQPVVVVQVKDAEAADKGLQTIRACDTGSEDETGWAITGDWAVVAPTAALAKATSEAAAESSLADDATYQKWIGEAGDPGVATLYAAPSAAAAVLEEMGETDEVPEQLKSQLSDFKGVAAIVRFTDGALEMEAAAATPAGAEGTLGSADMADQVGTLPADTAAAIGASLGEDWFQKAVDSFATGFGGGSSEDFLAEIESATGLALPEDVDTLTANGVVVALGPGIDPEALANAADPTAIPVALKLTGDADKIQEVVAKLQSAVPGGAEILGTSADGETVVIGPDADYRDSLTQDGKLRDSELYQQVVPNADSPGVLYLNVDAFDEAIASLGDDEVTENLEPLSAIGVSSTTTGDVSHVVVRIGTDK